MSPSSSSSGTVPRIQNPVCTLTGFSARWPRMTKKFGLLTITLSLFAAYPLHASDKLIPDKSVIVMDLVGTPTGAFEHTMRYGKKRFGPAPIVSHDTKTLVFRTRTDVCTLKSNKTIACSGASGTWRFK